LLTILLDTGASRSKDSVDLPGKLLDQYGSRLNYILVLNQLRDESFNILESSGLEERALSLNAKVITLKKLHAPVMTKVDGNSYSFWAATNRDATTENALSLLERQRMKIWLNSAYKEIESAGI
jgi:hypothetical protein